MAQNKDRLDELPDTDWGINEDCTVRDMRKPDIPEILMLQEKVLKEDGFDLRWFYPFSEAELEEVAGEKAGMAVGAFAEGKLIAFRAGNFTGSEYDDIIRILGSPYTETRCFLMNGAFVDPAWRGRHLQQTLTKLCIERCRKRGIGTFFAMVHPDNVSSMKSLKNLGFTERTRQMLYGGKYDRFILVKEKFE